MYKKFIILILLIFSYIIFFIFVDRNRQELKYFLKQLNLWNSEIYITIQSFLSNKNGDIKNKILLQKVNKSFELNHFSESHKLYDLEQIINNSVNKKLNYGYITSVSKNENKFKIFTSSGYLITLDNNFNLIDFYELNKKIPYFYTDFAYGGIRGAVWISNNSAIIYSTFLKDNSYYVGLVPIHLSKKKQILLDEIYFLEKLPLQDGLISSLGGGIVALENNIYLATGTTATPDEINKNILAQNDKSFFGKILKITFNFDNKLIKFNSPQILSKGHRNPQGLAFINNNLLSVEHGPKGGDEINLVKLKNDYIYNYGWPNYSYGTPYLEQNPYELNKTNRNNNLNSSNLKKSYNKKNKDYVEPIFYFTPSIGISDLSDCPFKESEFDQYKNCFLISSLKDESFYVMKYLYNKTKNDFLIKSTERVAVGERIRKIYSEINKVYLFLDSLSIIQINYNP